MKDNKGFSLIELIVAMAILGIVSMMCLGFIVSGMNGYSAVSSNINLQNKAQMTMNFIREYVIDCNEGLFFDSDENTLYVFSSQKPEDEEGKVYTAHVFKYSSSENSIYYGEHPATLDSGEFICSNAAPDLLANGVSSFSVALSGGARLSSATVTIDFFVRNKTFQGVETNALRNYPPPVSVNPQE